MATAKKNNKVEVKNYAIDGKEMGAVELNSALLEYKPNTTLLAQYVRVYLANQRQGNASAKMRSEVAGTTKKMYKQKGTGRARHGSMKAPIFKGGGVVGGPKPTEHRLSISKTQKKLSFLSAVAQQLQAGAIATITDEAASVKPSTKQFAALMKVIQRKKDSVLVIATDAKSEGLVKSLRNMDKVRATHMGELNAYDILDADKVLFVAQAFDLVQKMFTK